MTRKEWTNREIEILTSGWEAGISGRKLCSALPGRTESAIRARARWAGLVRQKPIVVLWSAEDDAILREIWESKGSLKSKLDCFPDRTWRSVVERGRKLGLRPRGSAQHSTSYSWVRVEIDRVLRERGAMTAREIAVIVPADAKYIATLLRAGCGKKYYIVGWMRPRLCGSGTHTPRFALGKMPNAPKPDVKPAAQCRRDYAQRQSVKTGRFNPFASLAMQVAA